MSPEKHSPKYTYMRILFMLAILVAVQEAGANTVIPYNIKGTVTAPDKNKIAYLYIFKAGKQPSRLLSAPVRNGHFTFTGSASPDSIGLTRARLFFHAKPDLTPKEYMALYQQGLKFKYRELMLEQQVTVHVTTTADMADVQGDALNQQQNVLQSIRQMEIDNYDSLAAWWKKQEAAIKGDKEAMVKLKADYYKGIRANEDRKVSAYMNFIKAYPASPLALQTLKLFVMMNNNPASNAAYQAALEDCIGSLPAAVKETSAMKPLIAAVNKKPVNTSKLPAGAMIPEYGFITEGNKSVTVKDFRGKYLLLDFWTSWCGPCRAEHYNMKQLYAKYKDRNFAILQVSLDDNDGKWKKALAEDNLPWAQLRCLKGWDKAVADLYDVSGVPTTYLIDPEGKIIASKIRGEALTKKIQELLGN